jgi:hypothetical protein
MTDQERITLMLDSLADMRSERELIAADKQTAIDQVLTDEVKAQLAAIDAEFGPQLDTANEKIAELEKATRLAAEISPTSVRGQRILAVITPPKAQVEHPDDVVAYAETHSAVKAYIRIEYVVDAEGLERYGKSDPGVLPFISHSKPKVALRDLK